MSNLNSSQLLVERVKKFNIPDWPGQVLFDRVLLYRIPNEFYEKETALAGGRIIIPESVVKDRQSKSTRMVIVGAGAMALDILRSNGLDLGHIVLSPRFADWRHYIERETVNEVTGEKTMEVIEFLLGRAGDIAWSEDLMSGFNGGTVELEYRENKHQYVIDMHRIQRRDMNNNFESNE
jgi:hypothetical protein